MAMSASQDGKQPIWPNGPNAAVHKHLRGKVERCDGRMLVGWLLDPTDPASTVEFDLLVNGKPGGRHRADQARGDLEQKGIGTGRHGFRVPLPPQLLRVGENSFRLIAGSRALEAEASFEITAPPPTTAAVPPAADAATPALPPQPQPNASSPPRATAPPQPLAAEHWLAPEPAARPIVFEIAPPSAPLLAGTSALVADLVARLGPEAEVSLWEMITARAKDRDWKAVLQLTEAMASNAPAEPRLLLARGRALLGLGEPAEAEPLLRDVTHRDPADHAALFDLSTALQRQQRFAEAFDVLARCRELAPQQGRYVLEAARAAAQAANGGSGTSPERPDLLPQAIALAQEAMRLMPRDGRPCRELARLLHQVGDHVGALTAMEEAERRQPAVAAFPLDRARILARLDRVEEAEAAAARATELDPASDGAQFLLRVLERWSSARRAGPWRVVALVQLPSDPPIEAPVGASAGDAVALPASRVAVA